LDRVADEKFVLKAEKQTSQQLSWLRQALSYALIPLIMDWLLHK
jgi:hypothetical protein